MGATFDVKIFDCTQVKLIAFGVPISKGPGASGYAPGVFLEIEQDGPSWKIVKGADGTLTRCATNEPGTKVTLHLLQSSASNAVLSAMWNLDQKGINGAGIGTFVASDMQGTSVFESEACWVMAPPKVGYGQEGGERIWELYCCKVERFDGGN
jgi:Protein of unknown function (DUF3277)